MAKGVPDTSKQTIAQLIEQLGCCSYGDAFTHGINPAQWSALRYFARANRFSRTVSAFACYHGTTLGTASQTIKALVHKRFVRRQRQKKDKRSHRLELTGKAWRLLDEDPFGELVVAAATLGESQRRTLARGLELMLHCVSHRLGRTAFGVCVECRHLNDCGVVHGDARRYRCVLLDESLAPDELSKLCVNFESSKSN